MALTHLIFPELSSSMSCLGWYCGSTGQAMWAASNRPKSGMTSGEEESPESEVEPPFCEEYKTISFASSGRI